MRKLEILSSHTGQLGDSQNKVSLKYYLCEGRGSLEMEGKRDAQRLGIGCRLDWQPPRTLKNPNPWRDWGRDQNLPKKAEAQTTFSRPI